MSSDLTSLADRIRRAASEYRHVTVSIEAAEARKVAAEEKAQNAALAKELVLQVAQKTQLHVGERISGLVSLALASVFDDPYIFEIDFVQRRGSTEADLWFMRNDSRADPLSCSGGGAVDIASFALRLAVWTMARTSPIFILDEPFRNLSLDMQAKAGMMLQELSRKMGIQIIMASHNSEIITGADRVFYVHSNGKIEQR